jgi:hypothetical protein
MVPNGFFCRDSPSYEKDWWRLLLPEAMRKLRAKMVQRSSSEFHRSTLDLKINWLRVKTNGVW